MSGYCQCGHHRDVHDDTYGYCKVAVSAPPITAGYDTYWPCVCRRLTLAETGGRA